MSKSNSGSFDVILNQVKSLLSVRAETETPVSSVSIRRIPRFICLLSFSPICCSCIHMLNSVRVPADMPLYDILNEFQKGSSHMAAVVKAKGRSESLLPAKGEKSEEENEESSGISELKVPLLSKEGENSDSVIVDVDKQYQKQANGDKPALQQNDAAATVVTRLAEDVEEGEVIGIITLEDVFEELLQVNITLTYQQHQFPCFTYHQLILQLTKCKHVRINNMQMW